MNDDDLIRAIKASAKRGREANIPPLDARARAAMADAIVASYPPARARRRRARIVRASIAAGSIALAASLALFVRPRSVEDDLPRYALVVTGGARDVRGGHRDSEESSSPLRLRKGDRFEIVLRPPTSIQGNVTASASLTRDAEVHPFRGAIEIAAGGTVRIAGTIDDFPDATKGAFDLVVHISRPNADPAHRQIEHTPVVVE